MNGNWVIKVPKNKYWNDNIHQKFKNKGYKSQGQYYVNNYIEKPKREIRKLKRNNISHNCYRVEYERARNYRQTFFSRTRGPYKCRYCNKKISKNQVYVDHIIPVAKVQKSSRARFLLKVFGCKNVNDIKNLAPACFKCNQKKSDKMGLWVFRGKAGKYKIYWILLAILKICLFIFAGIGVLFLLHVFQIVNIEPFLNIIKV